MKPRHMVPLVVLAGFGVTASTASSTAASPPAPSSTAAPPATGPAPKKAQEPSEIEIIDLNPEPPRDPQRYAVGGQIGGMWMTAKGSGKGTGAIDFAFLGSFGLGAGGARVPFTLDIWLGAAIAPSAFNLEPSQEQAPNRFTEIGARLVYHLRPDGPFSWLSAGGGLVWTSTRRNVDSTPTDPRCLNANTNVGVDCPIHGDIAPGALVEAGVGIMEWKSYGSRVGIGLRIPAQFSSYPGVGAVLFLYGQVGLRP